MISASRSLRIATSVKSVSLLGKLVAAQQLFRERKVLAELDAAALKDIGISKLDATAEATRPLWDAPVHWHK